jgi:hypothetical protein
VTCTLERESKDITGIGLVPQPQPMREFCGLGEPADVPVNPVIRERAKREFLYVRGADR